MARVLHTKWAMGLQGGVVIANPIPEQFAMPQAVIDQAIEQALAEASQQGIGGKETTPFLLARVNEITGGDSLVANIELVLNNARLAAAVARELVALLQGGEPLLCFAHSKIKAKPQRVALVVLCGTTDQ